MAMIAATVNEAYGAIVESAACQVIVGGGENPILSRQDILRWLHGNCINAFRYLPVIVKGFAILSRDLASTWQEICVKM